MTLQSAHCTGVNKTLLSFCKTWRIAPTHSAFFPVVLHYSTFAPACDCFSHLHFFFFDALKFSRALLFPFYLTIVRKKYNNKSSLHWKRMGRGGRGRNGHVATGVKDEDLWDMPEIPDRPHQLPYSPVIAKRGVDVFILRMNRDVGRLQLQRGLFRMIKEHALVRTLDLACGGFADFNGLISGFALADLPFGRGSGSLWQRQCPYCGKIFPCAVNQSINRPLTCATSFLFSLRPNFDFFCLSFLGPITGRCTGNHKTISSGDILRPTTGIFWMWSEYRGACRLQVSWFFQYLLFFLFSSLPSFLSVFCVGMWFSDYSITVFLQESGYSDVRGEEKDAISAGWTHATIWGTVSVAPPGSHFFYHFLLWMKYLPFSA